MEDAYKNALEIAEAVPNAVVVHPFEGEDVVAGNSTIVDEIYDQLRDEYEVHTGPVVISVVVGRGGLLNGILTSLEHKISQGMHAPLVVASQCFGADSFTRSHQQGSLVTLEAITSKATSMEALTCSGDCLKKTLGYANMHTLAMNDEAACSASWRLARDHRLLEIACGAALALVYFSDCLASQLFTLAIGPSEDQKQNVIIVVCAGSKDTLGDIYTYRRREETKDVVGSAHFEPNGQFV